MAQCEPEAFPEWQRVAYENSHEAVCVLTPDSGIVFLNEPARRLLRVGRDETGLFLQDCLPELEQGVFKQACERVLSERVPASLCVFLQGLSRWCETRICRWESGLTVFFTDVTNDLIEDRSLRESERRFRLLFENNPQPMMIWTVDDYRIVDVNESAVRTYGFTREEFLAMTVLDMRPEREIANFVARALAPGNISSHSAGPWLHRKKDGSLMSMLITSQRTEYWGRAAKFVTMEDVTSRLAMESALRQAEARYRSLVEASSQIVWTSAPDGVLSPPIADWTKFTGQTDEELRDTGWLLRVHPNDRAKTLAAWATARATETPYDIEHRILNRAGEYRIMHGRAVPVRDETGAICEWVGVHTDVTERRHAEQRLRDSEQRFRHVFLDSPLGIGLMDTSQNSLTQANPALARMLGYTPEELQGRPLSDISHPDDFAVDLEHFARLQRGGCESYSMEKRYIRKDGSQVTGLLTVCPMYDDKGGMPTVLGMVEDVTARKALEEQLRQAQKMDAIGRLAGGIAHDFNNLLTVIIGHTGLAELEAPANLAPSLREIREAAERAAALTRQLLAFSRRRQPLIEAVDLNTVVAGMHGLVSRLAGENIRVDMSSSQAPAFVRCDANQMEQVIMNLAVNARDAMPGGGILQLSINAVQFDGSEAAARDLRPGAYVRLRVTDTGHGMDERTLARVFEPFFTTKPPGQGTGLGLAIAYAAVRQANGAISVDSRPGQGTTFDIHLPASSPAPLPAGRAEPHETGAAQARLVLLVEDESGLRRFVKTILGGAGYTVIEADGPRAALKAASETPGIDLLLSDVVMPEMSGPQLALQLQRQYSGLKVLLMSGYPEHPSLPGELEFTYLQKPFAPADLLKAVAAALNSESEARPMLQSECVAGRTPRAVTTD